MNDKNHVQQMIGNNLRNYRLSMKMTQEELSEKAGISTSFLANLERGIKGMSIHSLRELCSALGVSADYLLFENRADGHIKNIEVFLQGKPEHLIITVEKMAHLLIESHEAGGHAEDSN